MRLTQSPRELSSSVSRIRCAELARLWLNPIMSNFHATRLLLLRWILEIFGPSMTAEASHYFRYVGDDQHDAVVGVRRQLVYTGSTREGHKGSTAGHQPHVSSSGRSDAMRELSAIQDGLAQGEFFL